MLTFSQILALLGQEPVALWGEWLQALAIQFGRGTTPTLAELDARVTPQAQRAAAARPGAVAVIPVQGIITAKPTMWERYGLTMSVASLVQATRAAINDPEVKAIIWDMDTPGGSTNGLVEGHAELMALRGKKPLVAQVDHLAASAGYWLASAADEIAASPSSLTGSIGVYSLHVDSTAALEQQGLKAEFIHAGRDKVLGNGFEPLTDAGRSYLQGMVDAAYGDFTRDVAAGRGVSQATAQGESFGMGRVLTADAAKRAGMVDAVRSLAQTLAAYGAQPSASGDRQRRALALRLLELDK